jgi:hypothetical protein
MELKDKTALSWKETATAARITAAMTVRSPWANTRCVVHGLP